MPTFSVVDLVALLLLLLESRQIGRCRLARELAVGEGSVRTMLKRAASEQLIMTSRRGCTLTVLGKSIAEELKSLMPEKAYMGRLGLVGGDIAYGILVKDAADKVKNGIKQRDEAIKAGANGAITIVKKRNRFWIPSCPLEYEKILQEELALLEKVFKRARGGDVVVLGFGNNERSALRGAIAAALSLIDC